MVLASGGQGIAHRGTCKIRAGGTGEGEVMDDQSNVITFIPRSVEQPSVTEISPWNTTSRPSVCHHGKAWFQYSTRRREVYCRECNEAVDAFTAFVCLGLALHRLESMYAEIKRFNEKAEKERVEKRDRLLKKELDRPASEQRRCNKCNCLLVQRPRGKGKSRHLWLECYTCGMGWRA